jgi:hypothetical protein
VIKQRTDEIEGLIDNRIEDIIYKLKGLKSQIKDKYTRII